MQIVGFGSRGGALDCEHGERPELGSNTDEKSDEMGLKSGLAPIGIPTAEFRSVGGFDRDLFCVGVIGLGRLLIAMNQGQGVGGAWNELSCGHPVRVDIECAPTAGEILVDPVGLIEGQRELANRNVHPDVAQITNRGESALRNLVDVEGELYLDVGVLALGVIHGGAVTCLKLWKLKGDSAIGSLRMTNGVADVMGKRTHCEGELVGILGIAKERKDKVAGANVVGKVGEELVTEG